MKRTIKILVLALCIMLFAAMLVSCGCSNNGSGDCNHTWNGGVTTKSPTCLEAGTKTYTCTSCGETYLEEIAKLEHTLFYENVLDGTHHVTCSYCTYSEYVNHTPTGEGTAFEATCTEAAYTLHVCKDCNGQYKLFAQDSTELGHDWGDWSTVKPANCKETGISSHECKRCFTTEDIVLEVNPDLHAYDNGTVTTPATCVSDGEKTFLCSLCGNTKTAAITKSTQHTWNEGEADGTGWVTQTCTVENCGSTRKHYDATTLENADVTINDLPDEDVSLGLQNATIQLPSDVVSQIKGSESEKVEISAGNADKSTIDTSSMSDEEKARLESTTVYDFGISIGGQSIGNFNAKVTVTIPYILGENEDSEGIIIWYVTDSGTIEEVEATYDETSETVTFSVSHFSYYAVAYKESQAMKCKRGVHDMEKLNVTVEPTCFTYGYTIFQCKCCLAKEPGEFKNKLDHKFSEFKDAEVTCEEGGYKYRVCENEGCGYIQTAEYVRAKGHTINSLPTCDKGVYCETCQKMIKTPLGHDYTPWTIDKNATEYEDGQKSRLCRKCGNKEVVTILAGTGVDAAHLESYQDLFEFILSELVGSNDGTISLEFDINGEKIGSTITLNVTEDSFKAYIESTGALVVGPQPDGEELPDLSDMKTYVIYDNGMCYNYMTEGEEISVNKTDINSAFASMTEGVEFNDLFEMVENYFYEINAMIEQYSVMIKQVINSIPEKFAGQIPQIYNALETVYSYYVLRLGFSTNIKMVDGMTTPTAKDVLEAFGTLLTKEESNGKTVYTFNIQTLIDEVKATLNLIKENENSTLGQFLYVCYEDAIKEIYPDVNSFESLMAALKADFSGETTFGQAFVKLASYLLKLDFTMDEIYDTIDSVMTQLMPEGELPEGASYSQMIMQYANLTLDELLVMIGQMEMPPMGGGDGGYGDGGYGDGGYGDGGYGDGGYTETDKPGYIVPGYGDGGFAETDKPGYVEPDYGDKENGKENDKVDSDIEYGENELGGLPLNSSSSMSDSIFDKVEIPSVDTEDGGSYGDGSYGDGYYDGEYGDGYYDGEYGGAEDGEMGFSMTMADIWAQAEAMLSQMTIGQVTIPMQGQEMTLLQGVTMIEQMLDAYKINLSVSFTVDENGDFTIVSLNGDASMSMQNPENPSEIVENKLGSFKLSFDTDKTDFVVPNELKDFVSNGVEYHFDSEGNLIISGVNGENTTISLDGRIQIPFDTILEKDETLSKELGIDVYHKYSEEKWHFQSYIKVNGKYYTYNHVPKELLGIDQDSLIPDPIIDKNYAFKDILANPSIILPSEDTLPMGNYQGKYDIYHSPLGFIAKLDDGQWYLLSGFTTDSYTNWNHHNSNNVETTTVTLQIGSKVTETNLLSIVNTLKFYMFESDYNYHGATHVSLFGGELDEKIKKVTLKSSDNSYDYIHTYGYFENDELYLVSYKLHKYELPYGNYVCELLEAYDNPSDYGFSSTPGWTVTFEEEKYWTPCYLNGKLVSNPVYVNTIITVPVHEYYYKVDDSTYVNIDDVGIETSVNLTNCEYTITLPNGKTMYVMYVNGNELYGYVSLGGGYYVQTYALCYGEEVEEFEYRNGESALSVYSYGYDDDEIAAILQLDKYVTKGKNTITISKELFDKLEICFETNERYYLTLNVTIRNSTENGDEFVSVYESYTPFFSSNMLESNRDNGFDSEKDWYYYFGDYKTKSFDILTNEDGTISLYYKGNEISLGYNLNNVRVDKIGEVNEELSESYGTTIYDVIESQKHHSSLVIIGGKYYHWHTEENYKVTYAPQGRSYKIISWYFDDLRYMATANYDGTDLDVYEAEVILKTAYDEFDATVYVTFVDGKLRILGGCEEIGDNAVQFETLVKPNDYFPNLIPTLPTVNQLSHATDGYLNGGSTVKAIYHGYINYVEPYEICLEGNNHAFRDSLYAVKNSNNTSYTIVDSYNFLGYTLIRGIESSTQYMNEGGYTYTGEHSDTYYNGTFVFADYEMIAKDIDHYFKLAGKFYYLDTYYWANYTYTKEEMIEAFYNKTFLYGVEDGNGNIILYTGDEFSSSATIYEGELRYQDADKVITMDANFIDGYDTVYQYIFYTVPEDAKIVTVDGTELYISVSGTSFAKAAENVYIKGIPVENADESYEFRPYSFSEAYITNSNIIAQAANKLTSNSDSNILTLSLEFAEMFRNCNGTIIVYIQGDISNTGYISIEELLMYFDLAASEK